jgi:hypothetical protein
MAPVTRSRKLSLSLPIRNRSKLSTSTRSPKRLTSKKSPAKRKRSGTKQKKAPANDPDPPQTSDSGNEGLCFDEAVAAMQQGSISEDVYFSYLIQHYRGVRHPFDLPGAKYLGSTLPEPIARSVWESSIYTAYENFSETEVEACKKLFRTCAQGDLEQFASILEELSSRKSLLLPPMILLAATRRHDDIFRYCMPLATGAGAQLTLAVHLMVFHNPEILDFLLEINWENIQNSPKALNRSLIYKSLRPHDGKELQVLRWLLAHGAKIPSREYQMMAFGTPPPDVLELLLV